MSSRPIYVSRPLELVGGMPVETRRGSYYTPLIIIIIIQLVPVLFIRRSVCFVRVCSINSPLKVAALNRSLTF